jgi:putative SOS response-associated peptidase YedK
MCGRFVGHRSIEELRKAFPIDRVGKDVDVSPNYNVAPTQTIPAIVRPENQNVLRTLRWGLVPFWAKDPSIGSRLINARSETVDAKPAFRNAFKKRRCLIPADGFYEWQGPKGNKQPMFCTLSDGKSFGFAGLWEFWDNKGKEEEPLYTCTILTTAASPSIREVHDRMPVILKREAYRDWMDGGTPEGLLKEILRTRSRTDFVFRPVSKAVNSVRNNSRELIKGV